MSHFTHFASRFALALTATQSPDHPGRSDRVLWPSRRGREWVVREFDAAGAFVGALDNSPPCSPRPRERGD